MSDVRRIAKRAFYWLRGACARAWELYRNCLEANPLLRPWMRRKTTQTRLAPNNDFVAWLPALLTQRTSSPCVGIFIAVLSTVTTLGVTGYSFTKVFTSQEQGQVIATGVNETATESLLDGTLLSLSERSTLTLDEMGPARIARLRAGEIILNVKASPERPFTVDTPVTTATVVADASFRVSVGSWIEIECYDGAIKLGLKGAKAGAPVRWLRKGELFTIPVDGVKPALAERRDSVSASDGG